MNDSHSSTKLLMLPWVACGHAFPLFELAIRLSKKDFTVYYASTPPILSSIKQRYMTAEYPNINLLSIQLPASPDLPPQHQSTLCLPLHLMPTLKKSFDLLKPTFASLLSTLNPDCFIYDVQAPWAPILASDFRIPSVLFVTISAACCSFITFLGSSAHGIEYPFKSLGLPGFEDSTINRKIDEKSDDPDDLERFILCLERTTGVVVIKSLEVLEGKFMDYFSKPFGKIVIPAGLLPPYHEQDSENSAACEFRDWMEGKCKGSVLFVSFGSEYLMSMEEFTELAFGLEMSMVNFIWMVKVGSAVDKVDDVLPAGFVERVQERGMMVKNWAPQMQILRHSSTGGFLSHCGWGSVCEAMWCGVPIIAMPCMYDQPVNAKLVVNELGVGVEIDREKDGSFKRDNVAKCIRKVLVDAEGEGVRRKTKETAEIIRECREAEIDLLGEELKKLAGKIHYGG